MFSNLKSTSIMPILMIFFLLVADSFGQGHSKEDIYDLDFMQRSRNGDSPSLVANYWIQLAKQEYYDLNFAVQQRPDDELIRVKFELLAVALKPILEVEQMLIELPPGESRQDIMQVVKTRYHDDSIAQESFEAIGPERARELVTARFLAKLRSETKHDYSSRVMQHDFFSSKLIAELLELTNAQSRKIEGILTNAEIEFAAVEEKYMSELDVLSNKRWNQLLQELKIDQRNQAKRLLGRPINWFQLQEMIEPSNDQQMWLQPNVVIPGEKSLELNIPIGSSIDEIPFDVYAAHGIELIDSLVHGILFETAFWEQLELTEMQREKLKHEVQKRLARDGLVLPLGSKRINRLLDESPDYPPTISKFLNSEQRERFRQIELQIRLEIKYDPTIGLTNPHMIDFLRLGKDQHSKLNSIGQQFTNRASELLRELALERGRIRARALNEIVASMTFEQREKFASYTGQKLVNGNYNETANQ